MKNVFLRWVRRYNEIIQIVLGGVDSITWTIIIEMALNKQWNWVSRILLIGVVVLLAHIFVIRHPKNHLEQNKEKIITNILHSSVQLLLSDYVNNSDWRAVGMIQVADYKHHVRRTPYYTDAIVNDMIRMHVGLSFGDVGDTFFTDTVTSTYFSKMYTLGDWRKRAKAYRDIVPSTLRAIFAIPIYSQSTPDSQDIIGVLEIDLFAEKEHLELTESKFDKINTTVNRSALFELSKAIAILMDKQ